MKQVFVFGKPVEGETFTDREAESARLKANFEGGINTFIISPRRWNTADANLSHHGWAQTAHDITSGIRS